MKTYYMMLQMHGPKHGYFQLCFYFILEQITVFSPTTAKAVESSIFSHKFTALTSGENIWNTIEPRSSYTSIDSDVFRSN